MRNTSLNWTKSKKNKPKISEDNILIVLPNILVRKFRFFFFFFPKDFFPQQNVRLLSADVAELLRGRGLEPGQRHRLRGEKKTSPFSFFFIWKNRVFYRFSYLEKKWVLFLWKSLLFVGKIGFCLEVFFVGNNLRPFSKCIRLGWLFLLPCFFFSLAKALKVRNSWRSSHSWSGAVLRQVS